MRLYASVGVMLCAALGLPAATLTVGTAAIAPGQSGTVSVTLTNAPTDHISGLQFDLTYDPTVITGLNVTAGSAASTALKAAVTAVISTSASSKKVRVIVIGGQTQDLIAAHHGAELIGNGAVATLAVTVAAGAGLGINPITVDGLVATTEVATAAVMSGSSGSVTVSNTFTVGAVSRYTPGNYTLASFTHNAPITIADLRIELYAYTGAVGYDQIPTCSDFFDALDTYPVDTPTQRGGGDGAPNPSITIADLRTELYYYTGAVGYEVPPLRALKGGCPAGAPLVSLAASRAARAPRVADGSVEFGSPQTVGAEERVPVYLVARNNLARLGMGFSAGDQTSRLRFVAGDVAPSIAQDSDTGIVAVAWVEGLTVRAGSRVLLGYIVGPVGAAANMRIFGASGNNIDDDRVVSLEFASRSRQNQ